MTAHRFTAEQQRQLDWCVEQGYITCTGGRYSLTTEGRRFFGIPDDVDLLQLGLETLVDEVFSEGMIAQAGRQFAEKKQ